MKTLAHSENAASLKGIHILLLDLCSHLPPAFKDVKNASSASGSRPPFKNFRTLLIARLAWPWERNTDGFVDWSCDISESLKT